MRSGVQCPASLAGLYMHCQSTQSAACVLCCPAGIGRRYFMLGGKGGVGKTSCSSSLAVRCAMEGHTTLVVSTDPAHSLSDSLDQVHLGGGNSLNQVHMGVGGRQKGRGQQAMCVDSSCLQAEIMMGWYSSSWFREQHRWIASHMSNLKVA